VIRSGGRPVGGIVAHGVPPDVDTLPLRCGFMAISPRSSVIAALVGVSLLLFTGCGGEANGARTTIGTVQTTSYVVEDPVPTTTTTTLAEGVTVPGGEISPVEQKYIVVANDSVYRIAGLHDIEPVTLANYNGWTEGINHPLNVGDEVKIPPNAKVPGTGSSDGSTDSDTGGTDTGGDTETDTDTGTTPDSSEPTGTGCQHTIVAGENPSKVATTYDITVDELIAANPGGVMDAFLVGATLDIPTNGTC
jgi:LysM repeat protein